MTPEQAAAVAHLTHLYDLQCQDNALTNARWPGLDDAEYAAACARFMARRADGGEIDEGWKRLCSAFEQHVPEAVKAGIEGHFWQPSAEEIELSWEPGVSVFDGRKGAAA